MKRTVLFFCVFTVVSPNIFAQYTIEVKRLSDRCIIVREINKYGPLNITALTTKKGIVVIDTGSRVEVTHDIRGRIEKEFGRSDFKYLINTHGHLDHAGGNQVFRDAEIIGHVKSIDAMRWHLNIRKKRDDVEEGFVLTPPTITFNEKLTIDMGDITAELIYLGQAHSGGDILIFIPEEKLLLVGDTFDYNFLPYIDSQNSDDVERWIKILDLICKREGGVKTVIPGHREKFDGKLLKAYLIFLQELWAGISKCFNEGLSFDETRRIVLKNISKEQFGHLKDLDKEILTRIDESRKLYQKKNQKENNEKDFSKGKSYKELMKLYGSPQNGYATLYWVDAGIINELNNKIK